MKVVFNGTLEKTAGGCSRCGSKRKGTMQFVRAKQYVLPSGRIMTFRLGVPEEVSTVDGNFLLSYEYTDVNGDRRKIFEEYNG